MKITSREIPMKLLKLLLLSGALSSAAVALPPGSQPGCLVVPWNPNLCPYAGSYGLLREGQTRVSLGAKAAPNWGTSLATIPTAFGPAIEANFKNNPNLNAMVTGMDNMMLARLSTELHLHAASLTPTILAYAAQKLNGANLRRLEAVFGADAMAYPIGEFAPEATLTAYGALPVPAPFPLSEAWWQAGKGAGVTDSPGDLYLWDLVLDSYTAGAGGAINPAIADTSRYMGMRIKESPIIVLLAVAALAVQISDSPAMQRMFTNIGDWFYLSQIIPAQQNLSYAPPLVIYWPPAITTTPDPTLPDFPSIDTDGNDYSVTCGGEDIC
jgi:hypothetical protein